MSEEWSAPDERGVRTLTMFLKPKRRISGERRRRAVKRTNQQQAALEEMHRRLLHDILGRFRADWRWDRVLAVAGHERVELASALVSTLLEAGYIEVIERRDSRGWQFHKIVVEATQELRVLAGLPDSEAMNAELAEARQYAVVTAPAHELLDNLESGRLDVRLRRAKLVPSLDSWIVAGRSGTRRDFALHATGDTKGVEDADWRWLETCGVLEPAGIVEHIPLLLAGGMFTIIDRNRRMLDVAVAQGPLGIPLAAIAQSLEMRRPTAWVVIENRTVFDKACALNVDAVGLLWVPGYAPSWWLTAVDLLLDRAPAKLVLACDPDPAGIEIALRVLGLWTKREISWDTAGMDARALDALPSKKPLTSWDRKTLERMSDLPPRLNVLQQALLETDAKGEQEGYFDEARLRALVQVSR